MVDSIIMAIIIRSKDLVLLSYYWAPVSLPTCLAFESGMLLDGIEESSSMTATNCEQI